MFGWKIENEFHINNIATHRNFRRLGVAKKMIDNIVTNLLPKKIFLEVSNFNNSAVMLYENLGFKKMVYEKDTIPIILMQSCIKWI